MKQSSKDVSIDLKLGNLYLFSPITERTTLNLFLLQWKVESRVTVMSQTQWLNRKTSLSLWVWDAVMCLHVFWIETINFTCAAVNFGSQVWTGVTLLKLKALLAYEKLYEEVLLEIPVLPEIHTSFKHKNERYVWQKTVTFHASINKRGEQLLDRHAHRGKRGMCSCGWVCIVKP